MQKKNKNFFHNNLIFRLNKEEEERIGLTRRQCLYIVTDYLNKTICVKTSSNNLHTTSADVVIGAMTNVFV